MSVDTIGKGYTKDETRTNSLGKTTPYDFHRIVKKATPYDFQIKGTNQSLSESRIKTCTPFVDNIKERYTDL